MKATIQQLAWYIERDGATLSRRDGRWIVRAPLLGGYAEWSLSDAENDELNAERDRVYKRLADRRRAAAAR
jgi:hypothetical protein